MYGSSDTQAYNFVMWDCNGKTFELTAYGEAGVALKKEIDEQTKFPVYIGFTNLQKNPYKSTKYALPTYFKDVKALYKAKATTHRFVDIAVSSKKIKEEEPIKIATVPEVLPELRIQQLVESLKAKNDGEVVKSAGIVLEVISAVTFNEKLKIAYAVATDGKLKCHVHFPLAEQDFVLELHDVIYMENITSSFAKPKYEIYGNCVGSLQMFTILSSSQPALLDENAEVEDYENVKDLLFPDCKKVV
uniref:Uncharacterized protein n=1 Tax=Panagrolaimus davidi TaxID=227884 RepID=A0A914PZN8_9BILA